MGNVRMLEKTGYLRYSGYFDWPKIYSSMASWMGKEQLTIYEKVYKDKTDAQGIAERELTWVCERKKDRMIKYIMEVNLRMWDVQPVEVTKEGKKKKMNRGRIRIEVTAKIVDDFQGKFEVSKISQKLYKIYSKITGLSFGLGEWDYWYTKMWELNGEFKKLLGTDTQ